MTLSRVESAKAEVMGAAAAKATKREGLTYRAMLMGCTPIWLALGFVMS
jgi:hypothetical protein